jgi:hypothetical protein
MATMTWSTSPSDTQAESGKQREENVLTIFSAFKASAVRECVANLYRCVSFSRSTGTRSSLYFFETGFFFYLIIASSRCSQSW